MRIVVVDDLRSFPLLEARNEVLYARTSAEGVLLLTALFDAGSEVDELWLDHDLGEETGVVDDIRPVVDLLLSRLVWDEPVPLGAVVVHTSNPVGAQMMETSLGRKFPLRRVDALSEGAVV